ncbi:TetR/AcrR family transcriptional regulator [Promicromonospora thailandica]|uniref:Transcriptional regulator, TetR family n=1 Tax=Promicromonospora thailandica TaxID=765201 RepID=A0A9X2JSR4_9MICO|nr:TetR/AcrR family transcriptional regulator [Promicromonospora thailandica]MCP2262785.1 transcriptional regulator, TetR family [Promicromonospora thailandica]BFF18113.1 TetR family transcriptional regulator [Promicromonospora thailandica]
MARWQPGTRGRLQDAALELFASRGYEQTTAAEIARSVGLTERTFFRHFSDKREVLFGGQERLTEAFVRGIEAAPDDATPMEAVGDALDVATGLFPDDMRPHSRLRQTVIDQHPALQERERHKMSGVATTIGDALRARGVGEPAATLAAESASTVFGIAFSQWIQDGESRSLGDISRAVLAELRDLTGADRAPR